MRRRFDDGYYEFQPDGSEVWRPTPGWLVPLARLVEWVSDQPQNYRWRRAARANPFATTVTVNGETLVIRPVDEENS